MIEQYLNELKAKKLSKHTIRSYKNILKALNDFKPLEELTKDDLVKFFNELKTSPGTISLYQMIIKKYFTDIGKPEIVSWIKKLKIKESLKSDDILTSEDINKLIDATDSHYWKALIAFLYETGCRIGEAQTLKFKDFVETSDGMIVNIPTHKTSAGYRKTILPFSGQYIRNLKAYINAKNEDEVFNTCYSHDWTTLSEIAKVASITKSVSPHKFRHAQATEMVKLGYNEAIIRKKLGWTPTSGMIARYQHLNDNDVIDATLERQGKTPKTTVRTELKEAPKLTLVDAASQFSKLSSENEELKQKMKEMEAFMKEISKMTGVGFASDEKDIPEGVKAKKVWFKKSE